MTGSIARAVLEPARQAMHGGQRARRRRPARGRRRIDKYGPAGNAAVSRQALESEIVEAATAAAEGGKSRPPSAAQAAMMLGAAMSDDSALGLVTRAACAARDRKMGARRGTVTFSKKSFFNIVNLCRDVCSYCTYRSEPAEQSAVMMSPRDVSALADMSARANCVEALIVAGERPEERYPEARAWLAREGYASTAEYIAHCSEELFGAGLFPHTNAGNLARRELADLSSTNASVGLMLESSSARLRGEAMPHANAPSKDPAARLAVLRDAGSLGLPATTGVLIGIGETHAELAESFPGHRGPPRKVRPHTGGDSAEL